MVPTMKMYKCGDCDASFEAETRKEILDILYEHYMSHHHDIITGASTEEKKQWMEKFEKDWLEAPEVQST